MRSLTQTSAGISIAIPSSSPPPSPTLHTLQNTHARAPGPPEPQVAHLPQITVPFPNRRPFFDVGSQTPLLSSQSRAHITEAIQSGWADSTMKRYSGAIDQFIRFCDEEGVPNHLRFPADEFVLCAFAASSVRKHSRSTPRNRLSALKAWHIAHNMEWKGSSRLRYVLNGVHNLAPRRSRRPPRPPVNAKMISQLVQHLDPDSPLDAVVAACATSAFWGQCRLGELLPAALSSFNPTLFPTRSKFGKSRRNPHSYILRLPRTKTHRHGQDVVLVDQCAALNPISLLKKHFRVNNVPNDAYLFSYTSNGTPTPLTKPVFLRRCNEIWQLLGYPRTTGHCFRIGGTTELLVAGIPPDVVKATGRWSSDSFLRYWRALDDIAPRYVRHLHMSRHRRTRT